MALIATLPYPWLRERVAQLAQAELSRGEVELIDWSLRGEAPERADLDLVVLPFHSLSDEVPAPYASVTAIGASIEAAHGIGVLQTVSIGYEGIAKLVPPGTVLCNAAGVMETQTAELAVALLLALQRDLPFFARARTWQNHRTPGLAGKRVVLLGHGGIGAAVHRLLAAFDADVAPVVQTARITPDGTVLHAVAELADLLPTADALVVTLPLTERTAGLVDAGLLAALPDGAGVVNVGRGAVVDTDALTTEVMSGRLRAGLDVTDPEPLPDDHPLWSAPAALITPHVGGNTDLMAENIARLVFDQLRRLLAGDEPRNVVSAPTTRTGGAP
ncbi:NAD(P)-dependent oxidoreductase [Microbacterium sp.]|uniref:NAD(P)-dependent oxidoreductase n=1 Tax=Microbacterium sp. TaxID=51671 RepID=UPI003C70DFC8